MNSKPKEHCLVESVTHWGTMVLWSAFPFLSFSTFPFASLSILLLYFHFCFSLYYFYFSLPFFFYRFCSLSVPYSIFTFHSIFFSTFTFSSLLSTFIFYSIFLKIMTGPTQAFSTINCFWSPIAFRIYCTMDIFSIRDPQLVEIASLIPESLWCTLFFTYLKFNGGFINNSW